MVSHTHTLVDERFFLVVKSMMVKTHLFLYVEILRLQVWEQQA